MILNGFEFGHEMRRPARRQMRGYGQPMPAPMPMRAPVPGGDPRVAQLEQALAQAHQRLAALGAVVNQLQQRLAMAQQRIVPAAQRVVDVGPMPAPPMSAIQDDARGAGEVMAQSAADRAWYGDHLRGAHPHDFGGSDFGDLDADLGLEG